MTVYFGPWPGEFGVFLGWQACARHAAHHLRQAGRVGRVVMCGRPGWEPLVSDFVDEYVAVDFPGVPVGSGAHGGLDAAELLAMVPNDAIHFPAFHTRAWGNEWFRSDADTQPAPQLFIRYGTERVDYKSQRQILLHARNRQDWGGGRNWREENWPRLAELLRPLGMLVSIGTSGGALHVEGTVDARDENLGELADRMRSALCVVGPSSGPMHYAALCGTPHAVWYGGDDGTPTPENNARKLAVLKERYVKAWNPFGVTVAAIEAEDWQPDVETVALWCRALIQDVAPECHQKPPDGPWCVRAGDNGRGGGDSSEVPVFILAYRRPDLAKEAIESVLRHTRHPYALYLIDNAPTDDMAAWLAQHAPAATYVKRADGGNVGCVVPRVWAHEEAKRLGARFWLFMDQDVRVTADGWLGDMVQTALDGPLTGMVAWPLANSPKVFANTPKPEHVPDATGAVLEVPGLCCLHSVAALDDAARKVVEPYFTAPSPRLPWLRETIHMWGFDTLACLILDKAGWRTRLVQGPDKIAHEHPHSGVEMNPDTGKHRDYSRKVCRRAIFDLGLKEVPNWL